MVNTVMNLVFAGMSVLLTIYLQDVKGHSPVVAGLLLLPSIVTILIFNPVGRHLGLSRGARLLVLLVAIQQSSEAGRRSAGDLRRGSPRTRSTCSNARWWTPRSPATYSPASIRPPAPPRRAHRAVEAVGTGNALRVAGILAICSCAAIWGLWRNTVRT